MKGNIWSMAKKIYILCISALFIRIFEFIKGKVKKIIVPVGYAFLNIYVLTTEILQTFC